MSSLGILGTGLIGASIGMRARRNGVSVFGYDLEEEFAAQALELGALDGRASREELYTRCATIVIAAPLATTCAELIALRGSESKWTLLVDVASVKRPVVDAGRGVRNFVATHPMAGGEGSGPLAARSDLFEGRTWAYVPSSDDELDGRARDFIASLGARPMAVGAGVHDEAVAVTSHLPQILAWLLSSRIPAGGELFERLCGPAGLEILRLGRSSRELWRDVLHENADAVCPAGRTLAQELAAACDAVDAGNSP